MKQYCPSRDRCSAILCPNERPSYELASGQWSPSESVCKAEDAPRFVKNQREIANLGLDDSIGRFTYSMLASIKIVRKGLRGLDSQTSDEAKWLSENSRLCLPRRILPKTRSTKASGSMLDTLALALRRLARGSGYLYSPRRSGPRKWPKEDERMIPAIVSAEVLLAVLTPELERLCRNAPLYGELILRATIADGEIGRVVLGIETSRKLLPREERGGSR